MWKKFHDHLWAKLPDDGLNFSFLSNFHRLNMKFEKKTESFKPPVKKKLILKVS